MAPTNGAWGLTDVRDLTVDEQGRIYVLDGHDQAIYAFDANGRLQRIIGRRGDGPGEYVQARSLAILRDSLWVIDGQNNRITGIALSGKLGVRTFQVAASLVTGNGAPSVLAVAPNGAIVFHPTPRSTVLSVGGAYGSLAYTDENGAVRNTIVHLQSGAGGFTYPLYRTSAASGAPVGRMHTWQPFGEEALTGVGNDGTNVCVVERPAASSAVGSSLLVTILGLKGDTLLARRVTYSPVPVSDRDFQHLVDSLASPHAYPRIGQVFGDRRTIADSLYRPRFWPPVNRLLVGRDGTIWLRRNDPSIKLPSYWLLSRAAVPEAVVTMPSGFTVLRASREGVWGWRPDADGVPIVERYSLR